MRCIAQRPYRLGPLFLEIVFQDARADECEVVLQRVLGADLPELLRHIHREAKVPALPLRELELLRHLRDMRVQRDDKLAGLDGLPDPQVQPVVLPDHPPEKQPPPLRGRLVRRHRHEMVEPPRQRPEPLPDLIRRTPQFCLRVPVERPEKVLDGAVILVYLCESQEEPAYILFGLETVGAALPLSPFEEALMGRFSEERVDLLQVRDDVPHPAIGEECRDQGAGLAVLPALAAPGELEGV